MAKEIKTKEPTVAVERIKISAFELADDGLNLKKRVTVELDTRLAP